MSGAKLMMFVDDEKNEIRLTPFIDPNANPVQMRVIMADKQGALAKITAVIGEMGINLTYEEAHILRKGEQAEWQAIADLAPMKESLSLEEIKARILATKVALEVEIQKYD
ncbi:MAG: hypothetical protein Q6365_018200 [Candidatus Sigynarchaeota archaeon]